jgi:hypothetical protein
MTKANEEPVLAHFSDAASDLGHGSCESTCAFFRRENAVLASKISMPEANFFDPTPIFQPKMH